LVIRSFVRLNHKIRVPEIRLNDVDGTPLGIMTTRDAMRIAVEKGLDLVEISPNAKPPVCRLMDYGKFRYEQSRKQRDQRKRQHQNAVKEIKFRPNVGDHDYDTKVGHLIKFLEKGHKVKISLTFRGRENAHRELGFAVVERVIEDCKDISNLDMAPKRVGRMVVAMLSPLSKKK
jgi:translation initiation factor IF-3